MVLARRIYHRNKEMNRRKDKKLLRMVLNEVLRNKVFGGQEIR